MNDKITLRKDDFARWYSDVVFASKLCSFSKVKGFMNIHENGYALWEMMQNVLDIEFKKLGHKNIYLPLVIPESLLNKEKDLVEGFAPEVLWVTEGGSKQLEERLCIRPTSETLFCEFFKSTLNSYRDLPKLTNQWCSVVRYEKETRPFLRTREFLWQEGHTIHETEKEAETEALNMLNVYKNFFEEYLAIPVVTGKKSEKEKFSGAEYTYTVEALMQNGICLQSSTSHYFKDGFTKAYDVKYLSRENKEEYPYQTSWGTTTRMIGALIMTHSDDKGLVLPPKIAPNQFVITTIKNDDEVLTYANNLLKDLLDAGFRGYIDDTDKSPGFKFAESEVNGIPVRIEVGKRDLDKGIITFVRRDNYEKIEFDKEKDKKEFLKELLDKMQNDLYEKALKNREEMTYYVDNYKEFLDLSSKKDGFFVAAWCGDLACEEKIKEDTGIKSRCITKNTDKPCFVCGKKGKHHTYWGKQY